MLMHSQTQRRFLRPGLIASRSSRSLIGRTLRSIIAAVLRKAGAPPRRSRAARNGQLVRRATVRKGQAHAGYTCRCVARRAGRDHAASFQADKGIGRAPARGCGDKLVESSRAALAEERRRAPFRISARAPEKAQKRSQQGCNRSATGRPIDRVQLRRDGEVQPSGRGRAQTMGSRPHGAGPSGVESGRGAWKKGSAS